MTRTSGGRTWIATLVESTAIFLFLYQALRVLFSVLFGLIYDALFRETTSLGTVGLVLVIVILALLAPLIVPRSPGRRQIALFAGTLPVLVARLALTWNQPTLRLVASVVIVAGAGIYLASRLRDDRRRVAQALILALIADQVLRALGHTWDITLRTGWWPAQAILSLALGALAVWRYRQPVDSNRDRAPFWNARTGLFWGGWLFLQTSLLAFPNALARWSGASYTLFATAWPFLLLLAVTASDLWRFRRGRRDGLIVTALLLAGLTLGSLSTGLLAALGLVVAQAAALMLLFSILLLPGEGRKDRLGPALAWGGILFLVLSFVHAFTFTYAYTLDLFRGMGLPVFLAAGLLTGLPALWVQTSNEPARSAIRAQAIAPWAIGSAWIVLTLVFLTPGANPPPSTAAKIRVATYNIHYGYDSDWHLSLEEQAQAMEASDADVVMLQEVDTGRPTSYMIDNALWLARRLEMDVVYQPTMEHLTGIALLSRYPVEAWEGLLLPSELEQTAILRAELDTGGTPVNAFATWLGLSAEERARQLDATLPFLAAEPGPAFFGGDLNSDPDSDIYRRIAEAGLVDAFEALGLGSPPTDPAVGPNKRIDFVWLRGLAPLDGQVLDSVASDHRLVVVEAALP
jgi:endonuclease/exonuclease/phosphatase family metal-dependent hydrolase